ncbi:MAG: ubiquinone/menaquinone biosynthesis methyltransferase [candidate division Zixibacteria bacterium]|nr:ubiquinone/menaquinone biosynthesis methyltransferase [candidate division Zixibacteria bacterium]
MNKEIKKIFEEVPRTYELVNHILTLGFDILLRKKAAREAVKLGGTQWLDVCCGTGEMAVNLLRLGRGSSKIFAADFSMPMLGLAHQKPEAAKISFILCDAGILPFKSESFDLITISFATRNINTSRDDLIKTLSEFHRVLRSGGRFVNLETSQPKYWLIRKLMHLYIKLTVRWIGRLISGSKTGYGYLSDTVPRFYTAEEFSDIILRAGFSKVDFKKSFFGAAAIHRGVK